MSGLIAIFSFALIWSTVNGVARCPFPGSTRGSSFTDKWISWQNRRSFLEGETVHYECDENWRFVDDVSYFITCQSDGSWSGSLPICGNHLFRKKKDGSPFEVSCSSTTKHDQFGYWVSNNTIELYEFGVDFCSSQDSNLIQSSTLDRVKHCSRHIFNRKLIYKCKQFDPREINYKFTIQMMEDVGVKSLWSSWYFVVNLGNQCGWPPVPVDADVVGEPARGNTTQVSYKCKNNLVLDPRGPQTSTCNQLTGQWTRLPRCIRPDQSVLENSRIIEKFTGIRQNNDEFIWQNRSWTSPSNPLPGQSPQFPAWMYPGHTVPANAEVVNRSSFSFISIISIVVCSFNYFKLVTL